MVKTLQKYFNRLLKFVKKNYKVIIVVIVAIYCLQQVNEGFDANKKLVVLYKPKPGSRGNGAHHINLMRFELFDKDNKKIPLTIKDYTSVYAGWPAANILNTDNTKGFHTAWSPGHTWKINNNGNQYQKPRWISFTYPADKHIKKVYVRNRDGHTGNRCCGNRIYDMKVKFFDDINADPNSGANKEYALKEGLDVNVAVDVPAKAAPAPEPAKPAVTETKSESTGTVTETPVAAAPPASSGGMSCFPETAITGNKMMKDLQIGDYVETSEGTKQVTTFLHHSPEVVQTFIRFILDNDQKTTVSKDHMILANGEYIKAEDVQPNDEIVYQGNTVKISEIMDIEAKGLYAPLTETGDIYVDNVLYSCYSMPDIQVFNYHNVANTMLYPLRTTTTEPCGEIHWYANGLKNMLL